MNEDGTLCWLCLEAVAADGRLCGDCADYCSHCAFDYELEND